jgi:AcrR family transcriptional regulator
VEERSRRIVETAVELAEQGGFDAVRLRDVASHAGVALGTLYRRFHSKEDLLLAALQQQVDDLRERVERRPPEGETPVERAIGFFQIVTRALCRRPNLTRALIRALATGEPELSQKVAAFHTELMQLIAVSMRGADATPASESELELAGILQKVWFSSLIGWTGGVHGQTAIIDQTRRAAQLLFEARDPSPDAPRGE